jgi:opacity protein-like surface antigen
MQHSIRVIGMLSFIALVAAVSPARAQDWAGQIVPYVGIDLIRLSTKFTDNTGLAPSVTGTAETMTARLKGGINITNWLAGEIHILVPRTDTYSTAPGDNTTKSNVTGIYAKPNYTLGPVNAYALVGFASAIVTLDGAIVGKQRASGASYGLGVGYLIDKHWSVNLDYMHYYKDSFPVAGAAGTLDVSGNAVGLGVTYTFAK